MDKHDLIAQLRARLEAIARDARAAHDGLAMEAREGATPDEKREDARAAHQLGTIGGAQARRATQAQAQADALAMFRPAGQLARVALGAIVEIEDEASREGRTFFLAPAGAGVSLTGPGGDGVVSVVTPASPIGRAVLGRRAGDVVDITVDGQLREWQITFVA